MKKIPLLLVATLGATSAYAQGIEVKLSGQINRALLHADDGTDSETFNVDNGNSTTRFRFNAEGPVSGDLKAGILFEVDYPSNNSSAVNFANRQVAPTLNERHMDLYFSGNWGMVRLGQGDGAANGASEVDLSGTTVAHYASTPDVGGAFEYRSGAALSGTSIGATISNQDFESRYDRIYYKTPNWSGFTGEASWGHKATDIAEIALRYSGKMGSFGTLAAAIGYSSEDSLTGYDNADKTTGGSISWLHPSGFNLTYAHTTRDLVTRDGKFDYFKVGYKFGRHAVSVDHAMGKDQAAAGDEAAQSGIGYVFTPVAWAEIFALYKVHSLERSGVSLDDVSFFMVGSRVKF